MALSLFFKTWLIGEVEFDTKEKKKKGKKKYNIAKLVFKQLGSDRLVLVRFTKLFFVWYKMYIENLYVLPSSNLLVCRFQFEYT